MNALVTTTDWEVAKDFLWNDLVTVTDFDYQWSWKRFRLEYVIQFKPKETQPMIINGNRFYVVEEEILPAIQHL